MNFDCAHLTCVSCALHNFRTCTPIDASGADEDESNGSYHLIQSLRHLTLVISYHHTHSYYTSHISHGIHHCATDNAGSQEGCDCSQQRWYDSSQSDHLGASRRLPSFSLLPRRLRLRLPSIRLSPRIQQIRPSTNPNTTTPSSQSS